MTWRMIRADEYCASVRDGTHDTPKPVDVGYKLVTGKHIKAGQIDPSDAYFISEADYETINERSLVEQWDVIMSMIGTVGEAAIVKNVPDYAIKNVALFKCGGFELRGKWLAYYLRSDEARGHMLGNQKGSSQQFLSLKQLRSLPVPVTDEETMRRVVNILSAYDDLIENNQKQIKLLEESAQRLYREWFVELRFPGHEMTPVVDGVPEGWEVKKVADLSATLRRGISPVYNDKAATRVINQKCIRQTIVDYSESRMQEKVYHEELALRDSDTVICSTGAGTLGRVGQIHGECSDTTLDSHVTLVRANASTGKQFLFWSLKAQQAFFMGAGKGSTNQLELSRETIGSLDVLVPTKEIMCTFEQHAQAIHDKQTACTQQNILLKDARDRLLPKLMSGQINNVHGGKENENH